MRQMIIETPSPIDSGNQPNYKRGKIQNALQLTIDSGRISRTRVGDRHTQIYLASRESIQTGERSAIKIWFRPGESSADHESAGTSCLPDELGSARTGGKRVPKLFGYRRKAQPVERLPRFLGSKILRSKFRGRRAGLPEDISLDDDFT